jgi:hypothetical protein
MHTNTPTCARRLDACVHQPVKLVHQFETQELTYLLVCCGAHKGRRELPITGMCLPTQTGIILEDQQLIAADQPRSWAWMDLHQGEPRSDLQPL